MLRLYPLIILIQLFCLYHAYTNRTEQKWFWIIIFFPFIGSVFYLYHHFYSRRNLENVKEGLKETFISNYTIDKLEQKVKFSDTYANKMELAKAHIDLGNNDRAIEVLDSCWNENFASDPALNTYLFQAHYQNEDYHKAITYAKNIVDVKEFQNSNEMAAYAWALYRVDNIEEAKGVFEQLNVRFANYSQRLEYAYFLQESGQDQDARVLVSTLMEEIQAMDSYERKINKGAIRDIKALDKSM